MNTHTVSTASPMLSERRPVRNKSRRVALQCTCAIVEVVGYRQAETALLGVAEFRARQMDKDQEWATRVHLACPAHDISLRVVIEIALMEG
jgi:hypothetical protein